MSPEDDWDFYPCRVDDAPASIFLNLALCHELGHHPQNTLYVVQVEMADPDAHGMGSAAEAAVMFPVEDALLEELAKLPIRYVGRLRNRGIWQITFMGMPGLEADLGRIASAHVGRAPRPFTTLEKPDAEWSYYSEFLFPDAERMRWIQDRRVVQELERQGDQLERRRRVEHWLSFPDAESRSAFMSEVTSQGFEIEDVPSDAPDYRVRLHREESVQLHDIHETTNLLSELAERHNGDYDGWETSVEAN